MEDSGGLGGPSGAGEPEASVGPELEAMLSDPRFLSLMSRRTEPGIFVSGLGLDEDGVEEGEDDMDTEDPARRVLKSAEHGDLAALRELLAADASLVGARDSDGYTPLHRAAYNDHGEAATALLAAGADVMGRTENGWTPLHCAACWGCAASAAVLLGAAAEPNARTKGGLTPLHLAAACTESAEGAVAVVRLLLAAPAAQADLLSGAGETAAQIARRNSGPIYTAITGHVLPPPPPPLVDNPDTPDPDADDVSHGSFDSLDVLSASQIDDLPPPSNPPAS